MIKQILGRLPKKPSKSSDAREALSTGHSARSKSTEVSGHKSGSVKDGAQPGFRSSANSGFGNKILLAENAKSNDSFEALPGFQDVPSSERQNLFVRKLNMCCVVFDFTDPTKNTKEKELKRQTLLELVDFVTSANGKFPETTIKAVIKMVSANLFRSPTAQPRENAVSQAYDFEEDEPLMDPAWPHLQIVYELFLRFVASPETDTKLAKRHIDHPFLLRLLDLFDSEDPRERESLKTILHRIYGKFMVHRPFIRKSINNIFYHFVFETEKFNGVAALLEVLGSIINGFALPLKEEHKLFLVRVLIPLHRPKCLPMYHQQLSYCITQFVEKDSKLADTVIRGLLKCWPITSSSKEVMFLSELEEVLEGTQQPEFQRCMVSLFRRISYCLSSLHFQFHQDWELKNILIGNRVVCSDNRYPTILEIEKVAERALYLWNNDHIQNLIMQNRRVILPIIMPALESNSQDHWNQVVQSVTRNVRKIFTDADPDLFQECVRKFQESEAKQNEAKAKHEATWKRLEEVASKAAASTEASLPPGKIAA